MREKLTLSFSHHYYTQDLGHTVEEELWQPVQEEGMGGRGGGRECYLATETFGNTLLVNYRISF